MISQGIYINASGLKTEFIKVSGFSSNIQKSNVILHTIKEQLKIKIKKILSFMITLKMKHTGKNLRKCVKDLYIKHYKVCWGGKKLYKWRAILNAWIRKLNILKKAILPSLIHRSVAIPIGTLIRFLKIPKSWFYKSTVKERELEESKVGRYVNVK